MGGKWRGARKECEGGGEKREGICIEVCVGSVSVEKSERRENSGRATRQGESRESGICPCELGGGKKSC